MRLPRLELSSFDKLRYRVTSLSASLLILVACSGEHHGPDWSDLPVTPSFSIAQDTLSTTFEGWVEPKKEYIFGPADGVSFTTANLQLTVNMAAVWASEPIKVEAFLDEEDLADSRLAVASWTVPVPGADESATFVESPPVAGAPQWIRVRFSDFAGQCVLQVLGHH
ncbi:MAG: hypothetical protein MK135_04285 [Polyangiaceae bacterium]|nr:hypothetical protein [Polyangiaceae bacterium]